MKRKIILSILLGLLLAACTTPEAVRGVSTAVMAAGGAYGGYQACRGKDRQTRAGCATMGGIAGAVIGNFIGSQIVKYMDRSDRQQLNQALNRRQNRQWRNPETGTVFQVSDIRTYDQCSDFTLHARYRDQGSTSEQHHACQRNGSYL